jgi:prepilin-type processing-associated H-X9-DG protein
LVLGLLPPPLSLAAFYVGLQALRRINASEGQLRGGRLALAGIALAILWVVVSVLLLAAIIIERTSIARSRAICMDNQRAIGEALAVYGHFHQGELPAGTIAAPDIAPEKRLSWCVALLPYLDQPKVPPPNTQWTSRAAAHWKALSEQIDPTQPWSSKENVAAQQRIARFLCPSSRHLEDVPGVTSYPGVAGVDLGADAYAGLVPQRQPFLAAAYSSYVGRYALAAALPKTDLRAGLFGYDRVITIDEAPRGQSMTMASVESDLAPGPWSVGGPATDRGLAPLESDYIGVGRPYGGLHPTGANVLWADGSVRMVRNGIDPVAFRSQALLAGPGK